MPVEIRGGGEVFSLLPGHTEPSSESQPFTGKKINPSPQILNGNYELTSFLQETHAAISLVKLLYAILCPDRGLYCDGTEHFTWHQNQHVH